MSSLEFERRKKSEPQLNIAPLLDIVFLLLIFFVLTSHFVTEKGFNIKLPKAAQASILKTEKITVSINENKNIFIENRKVELDELEGALEEQLASAVTKTVVVKADKCVDIGFVVKIMDIARTANAEGLVISTKVFDDDKN